MEQSPGLAFDRIDHIHGSTYKDSSTVIVVPMRGIEHHDQGEMCKAGDHRYCRKPWLHTQVAEAHNSIIGPMNQKRTKLTATGHEVGRAYDAMIAQILAHPELSKYRFLLTIEDDNLPPPDAHTRLLESIDETRGDAVSGIYFTKGEVNMPQAYGDPQKFVETGALEFGPIDVRGFLQRGSVVEVNGIAMGCALWRMDLFREIPAPWFVTVNDFVDGGIRLMTQDLSFCEKARRAGKRFFVDFRVKVGHMDVNTGVIY